MRLVFVLIALMVVLGVASEAHADPSFQEIAGTACSNIEHVNHPCWDAPGESADRCAQLRAGMMRQNFLVETASRSPGYIGTPRVAISDDGWDALLEPVEGDYVSHNTYQRSISGFWTFGPPSGIADLTFPWGTRTAHAPAVVSVQPRVKLPLNLIDDPITTDTQLYVELVVQPVARVEGSLPYRHPISTLVHDVTLDGVVVRIVSWRISAYDVVRRGEAYMMDPNRRILGAGHRDDPAVQVSTKTCRGDEPMPPTFSPATMIDPLRAQKIRAQVAPAEEPSMPRPRHRPMAPP